LDAREREERDHSHALALEREKRGKSILFFSEEEGRVLVKQLIRGRNRFLSFT